MKSSRSMSVPKAMLATFEAVAALTDTFCHDNLNDEYRDLARAMTAALCRKRPMDCPAGSSAIISPSCSHRGGETCAHPVIPARERPHGLSRPG